MDYWIEEEMAERDAQIVMSWDIQPADEELLAPADQSHANSITDQAAERGAELGGSEAVHCACCGEDCTGIENHDAVSYFEKGREIFETMCNGCIEHELGPAPWQERD